MMKRFDKAVLVLRRFFRKLSAFNKQYSLNISFLMFGLSYLCFIIISHHSPAFKVVMAVLISLWIIMILLTIEVRKLELQMSVKIPVIKQRLTYKDGEGNICLDGADREKALIYLYELEEFIKNNSLEG